MNLDDKKTIEEVRYALYQEAGLEYIPTNQVLLTASKVSTTQDQVDFNDLQQKANVTYDHKKLTYQAPYKDPIQQVKDYKNGKNKVALTYEVNLKNNMNKTR